jgi:hypothetical protein
MANGPVPVHNHRDFVEHYRDTVAAATREKPKTKRQIHPVPAVALRHVLDKDPVGPHRGQYPVKITQRDHAESSPYPGQPDTMVIGVPALIVRHAHRNIITRRRERGRDLLGVVANPSRARIGPAHDCPAQTTGCLALRIAIPRIEWVLKCWQIQSGVTCRLTFEYKDRRVRCLNQPGSSLKGETSTGLLKTPAPCSTSVKSAS